MEQVAKTRIRGRSRLVVQATSDQVCSPYTASLLKLTSVVFRTSKSMVRDELGIPEQTRYLVPIELGRVEKHVSTHLCCFLVTF